MGPILFLLYINELPKVLNCSHPTLVADVIAITFRNDSSESFSTYRQITSMDITNMQQKLVKNNLSLNMSKSKAIALHKLSQSRSVSKFNIKADNN